MILPRGLSPFLVSELSIRTKFKMDDSFYELELFFSQSEEIDLYLYDSIDDKPILPLCIDLLESADYEKQSNAVFTLLSYVLQ